MSIKATDPDDHEESDAESRDEDILEETDVPAGTPVLPEEFNEEDFDIEFDDDFEEEFEDEYPAEQEHGKASGEGVTVDPEIADTD